MNTRQVKQNSGYRALVSVGLVSYGVVHLVIAWLSLQLAWGGGGGQASSGGALAEISKQPLGGVLLWIVAVGMFALVVWQGLEAAIGHQGVEDKKRTLKRVSSAGKAIVYLAIGFSSAKVAAGAGGSSGNTEETVTSKLLGAPFGRVLVVILGLVVVGIGVAQVVKGVKRKFREDLDGGVPETGMKLGVVGFVAKGIAIVIVGLLFGFASITYDADKAGGLDAALKTIKDQPFGAILLTVMALGIACFGLYCFVWSRNAKR